jgi:DnaK suppressor protein
MAPNTLSARTRLETMLGELDRSIAILKSEHPEADAGTSLFDVDRTEAGLDAMERQRAAVVAALARTAAGTYGQCGDCGHPVPEGRLEARPEAARCLGCQSRAESRGRPLQHL